uniref:Uncharacterized protein n=1 Tax=Anguilla anguilla TaxID=7936 RepID=A0A0E9Y1D2_ANGAN
MMLCQLHGQSLHASVASFLYSAASVKQLLIFKMYLFLGVFLTLCAVCVVVVVSSRGDCTHILRESCEIPKIT